MSTEKVSVRESQGPEAPKRSVTSLLVAAEGLSAETVNEIRRRVQADPTAYQELRDFVREVLASAEPTRKSRADGTSAYARGMALWLLGRYEEAAEVFGSLGGRTDVKYYFGSALAEAGRWERSAEVLASVAKKSEWYLDAQVLLAEVSAKLGKTDEAQALLEALPAETHQSAEYWATRGLAAELGGEVAVARELYHRALELDPNHPKSLFRLAYSLDLSGSDDQAIELYERCVNLEPTHINALVNLGVLYEDRGETRKAIQCYEWVLAAVPTHERAQLYLKGAQATLSEAVDEVELKRRDQLERVLGTPITDFELSVRSQKCLEQMNIHTLGDLTRVTEADLLARKNFGETSLAEIKAVMNQKGLLLGQALEESEVALAAASSTRSRKEAELASKLAAPLSELELSVRSRRCMEELQLQTVGELTEKTEEELLGCRNFGQVSLAEVREKLIEVGLRLKSGA